MKTLFKATLLTIVLAIAPVVAFAATPITLEGSFQGANCIFYNKACPTNMTDGHIAIEPDFIFVDKSGAYAFIPNLDRGLKIKYLHKNVKIIGDKTGDSIRAKVVEVQKHNQYKEVWTLAAQEAERDQLNKK